MAEAAGTFTKLMEMQRKDREQAERAPRSSAPKSSINFPSAPPAAKSPPVPNQSPEAAEGVPLLPPTYERAGDVGVKSHSFRLTISELIWLRRFTTHLRVVMDRDVSNNTLMRLLLRLAQDEWQSNPEANRLRDLIDATPED